MSLIGGPTCILGWSVDVVSPPLGLRRPGSPVSRRGVRPCVSVVRFGTVLGTLTVAFCDDTFGTRLRLGGTQRGGPRAPPLGGVPGPGGEQGGRCGGKAQVLTVKSLISRPWRRPGEGTGLGASRARDCGGARAAGDRAGCGDGTGELINE